MGDNTERSSWTESRISECDICANNASASRVEASRSACHEDDAAEGVAEDAPSVVWVVVVDEEGALVVGRVGFPLLLLLLLFLFW